MERSIEILGYKEKHEVINQETGVYSVTYLMDCMDGMAQIPKGLEILAVVDPPYGININMNMGRKKGKAKRHKDKNWDNAIPLQQYFELLINVSINQIIWGGNYFPYIWQNGCNHFIFWDKLTALGMSFSDGELAWTSFNKANRKFVYNNMTNDKIHPTQKPVALYDWIYKNYSKPTDIILDTHLGSQSSRIAADKAGLSFIGFETDPDYFQQGNKRFEDYKKQLKLF